MAKNEKLIKVKVAPRKSVELAGERYGPGSVIELEETDARDLYAKGFVVDPNGEREETAEGGVSVSSE